MVVTFTNKRLSYWLAWCALLGSLWILFAVFQGTPNGMHRRVFGPSSSSQFSHTAWHHGENLSSLVTSVHIGAEGPAVGGALGVSFSVPDTSQGNVSGSKPLNLEPRKHFPFIATKDSTVVIVAVADTEHLRKYAANLKSFECYCKLHGEDNFLFWAIPTNYDHANFRRCKTIRHHLFKRHCFVSVLLTLNVGLVELLLHVDADNAVVNMLPNLRSWLPEGKDIAFQRRFFNMEITASSYLVRNTAFSRDFVDTWKGMHPFRHNLDNGALHAVILQKSGLGGLCMSTLHSRSYDAYLQCFYKVIVESKCAAEFFRRIVIWERGDGWEYGGVWVQFLWSREASFMHHGYKVPPMQYGRILPLVSCNESALLRTDDYFTADDDKIQRLKIAKLAAVVQKYQGWGFEQTVCFSHFATRSAAQIAYALNRQTRPVAAVAVNKSSAASPASASTSAAGGGSAASCAAAVRSKVRIDAEQVTSNTMLSEARRANVLDAAIDVTVRNVEGNFIETGTWKGGNSLLAAEAFRAAYEAAECPTIARVVWLADSFEGLPEPRSKDTGGRHAGKDTGGRHMDKPGSYGGYGGLEHVKALFARDGFDVEGGSARGVSVRFLHGWFKDTIPNAPVGPLAILRLDGDMYSSTMDTIVPQLYPKLVIGGYLIIDDYGHWIQTKKAVDDYFNSHQLALNLIRIDYTGRYLIKPAAHGGVEDSFPSNLLPANPHLAPPARQNEDAEIRPDVNRISVVSALHTVFEDRDTAQYFSVSQDETEERMAGLQNVVAAYFTKISSLTKKTRTGFVGHVGTNGPQMDTYLQILGFFKSLERITVCETGFNAGHSAAMFLSALPIVHYYGWDLGKVTAARVVAEMMARDFEGRFTVTWGDSKESIAAFFADKPNLVCDFVVVDGEHTGAAAQADTSEFRKHMSKEWVLAADDCVKKDGSAHDIMRGLDEGLCHDTPIHTFAVRNVNTPSPGFCVASNFLMLRPEISVKFDKRLAAGIDAQTWSRGESASAASPASASTSAAGGGSAASLLQSV